MKILLDESVPRLLKLRLPQLDISTVQEMGWAGLRNGELLRRAEEHFDVFITADQNLRISKTFQGGSSLLSYYPATKYRWSPDLCRLLRRCWRRFNREPSWTCH